MKQSVSKLFTAASIAAGLLVSGSAFAATQVADFDTAVTDVTMFKHHNELFAFADAGQSVSVYTQDEQGGWEDVTSTWKAVEDMIGGVQDIGPVALFKGKTYMAVQNTDGVAEVWSIKRGAKKVWRQSGEDGFGDAANTVVSAFFSITTNEGKFLYAVVENGDETTLYRTRNGATWTQAGSYGFTDVVGVAHKKVNGSMTLFMATADGTLHTATRNDLTTWSALDEDFGEITAIKNYKGNLYIGVVTQDSVAKVLMSSDGETFVQVGEDGLGNANTERITKLQVFPKGGTLYALTENSTDGTSVMTWDADASAWVVNEEAGYGNVNNTASSHMVTYQDDLYVVARNSVDGVSIYQLD